MSHAPEDLEDATADARCNLALLQQWATAESVANRGGYCLEREQMAFRAASKLLWHAERTMRPLEHAALNPVGGAR
jgi:hypothetical protein